MNNEKIFGDFPTPNYEEWRNAVDKALKGAPFDKKMVSQTYEGISLHPLYTSHHWQAAGDPSGLPGRQPFTRGFSACGVGAEGWCVRQEHVAPDPKVANAAILADLKYGVTSLVIRLDKAARSGFDPDQANPDWIGVDGVMAYARADFDALLDGVQLDFVPIALSAGSQFLSAAAMLASLWQQRNVTGHKAKGAFNADPLGALAETGTLPVPVERALAHMADLAAYTARNWPNVTAVGVDTMPYYEAGATESQDLAYAMATGVAYLRAMTAAGIEINTACRQIAFTFPVSCNFFLSMAKLRAARKLWTRITESCTAATPTAARIHARTTERMMTRCDPWVNMLRTTTAAFAAGVAGANSITVLPFDHTLGHADDFSRRIARNSQIILREESSLTRVIDPAGGSWYVENLTDQLAHAAWGLFQDIEKAGGMENALKKGIIEKQIHAVRVVRERNIAHRRDPITGVSEFPNIAEIVPSHPDSDLSRKFIADQVRRALPANRVEAARVLMGAALGSLTEKSMAAAMKGATIGSISDALATGTSRTNITSLQKHSFAEAFEALRVATATYKKKTSDLPTIFLANLGPIAAHTGRATYAKNFFEAGGIKTLTNNGFTEAEACAAAFQDSGARMAIICSSDVLYAQYVSTIAPALKAAGCTFLFLAGNPGDRKEVYLEAGVDDFIFVGCDVLGSLRTTLSRLGVTH